MFTNRLKSLFDTTNIKKFQIENEFGKFSVHSNSLNDTLIKEYEKKFTNVKNYEEFQNLCNEFTSKVNNTSPLFKEIDDIFNQQQLFFNNFKTVFCHEAFSPLSSLKEEQIDKKIEELLSLKEKLKKQEEHHRLIQKKNEIKQDIKNLEIEINDYKNKLIEVLEDEYKRNEISNKIIDLKRKIKELEKDL